MPTIDLRDPEIRMEAGLMTETVSGPSQHSGTAANGRSRGESADLVIALLHEHGPLTRLQLCRLMGRAKGPRLIALFEGLADAEQIVRGSVIAANGREAIIYGVEE